MRTYSDYLKEMKKEWIGKSIKFDGCIYKVVDVDANGFLLIDRKARYTDTTAVAACHIEIC